MAYWNIEAVGDAPAQLRVGAAHPERIQPRARCETRVRQTVLVSKFLLQRVEPAAYVNNISIAAAMQVNSIAIAGNNNTYMQEPQKNASNTIPGPPLQQSSKPVLHSDGLGDTTSKGARAALGGGGANAMEWGEDGG